MTKYAKALCKLIEEKTYEMACYNGELIRLHRALKKAHHGGYKNSIKLQDIFDDGEQYGFNRIDKLLPYIKEDYGEFDD